MSTAGKLAALCAKRGMDANIGYGHMLNLDNGQINVGHYLMQGDQGLMVIACLETVNVLEQNKEVQINPWHMFLHKFLSYRLIT